MELFQTNGEPYAKIQKSESQFRSKQYEVKLAEIFLVPDNPKPTSGDENDLEEHSKEDELNDNVTTSIPGPVPTQPQPGPNSDHVPLPIQPPPQSEPNASGNVADILDGVRNPKRIPRKAAMKCSEQTKNLISGGLLKIKVS